MEREPTRPDAGLCNTCVHQRSITSGKGSLFSLCDRARVDPGLPKYLRLPVLRSLGHEARDFSETAIFEQPGYPRMAFVEKRCAHEPTNWWIPNRAGVEAMLRSSGFVIENHPEDEVYVCRRELTAKERGDRAVYPAR